MPQPDLLGYLLRGTPGFKGKSRLMSFWMQHRDTASIRRRRLPGGGEVSCQMSVPYEAMVWLRQEEQTDLKVVSKLLKKGQTFVDCGANIGLWSITASASVSIEGQVYSFEPNPTTASKLKRHAAATRNNNINVFPSAVGASEGEVAFKCDAQHNVSQIIAVNTPDTISVPMVTLDGVLKDVHVSGCKIDVEGSELAVLIGARRVLETHKPWLCIEFNTIVAGVNRLQDWDVHQFLQHFGYQAYPFDKALQPNPSDELPRGWQTQGYCNLFYTSS